MAMELAGEVVRNEVTRWAADLVHQTIVEATESIKKQALVAAKDHHAAKSG